MGRAYYGELRAELMQKLEGAGEWTDEDILEQIDELVLARTRRSRLSVEEKEMLRTELFYSVRKLDVIQELIDDDTVTEIMVNGYENIFYEKQGKINRWDIQF